MSQERLAAKGDCIAPFSIHRSLEAMHESGIVHRLESRNAFFACHVQHDHARDQLILACERCGRVAEVDGREVLASLGRAAERADFLPRRMVTEVSGLCAACRNLPPRSA